MGEKNKMKKFPKTHKNVFFQSCCLFILAILICGNSFAKTSKSYQEVKDFIYKVAQQYPKSARIFPLGVSDSGEVIEGLEIGSGPIHNLLVATHHGNEYGSTEVAKAFAESVAQNPITGQTIYVIPVLNINGYNARRRWETVNGRSIDPNRDYPGPCGTEGPFHLKSTTALAKFIEEKNIVNSATLHTYYPAVVYPWGLSSHDLSTPYDDIFKELVTLATQESHYETGNSSDVIYPADGTYEDYAFWKFGIWSLLYELGYSHSPSDSDIEEMIQKNVPGLRRVFENSPVARAEHHEFNGKCDRSLLLLDRHDE